MTGLAMADRADDWLRQAQDDLLWAEDTLKAGRWAQACFAAQQVAEKALKSVALRRGVEQVRSHSILEITKALDLDGDIERMAKRLDQYYISARYPDAFPSGAPFEYFTADQAAEAVSFARKIVAAAARALEGHS
jgi:HEPN domain-containing protein